MRIFLAIILLSGGASSPADVVANFTCEQLVWQTAYNPGCAEFVTPDSDFPFIVDGECREHLEPQQTTPDYYYTARLNSPNTLEFSFFNDTTCTMLKDKISPPSETCLPMSAHAWVKYDCRPNL